VTRFGVACIALALLACASPLADETLPAAEHRTLRKIALVPLRLASPEVAPERPDAAELVTARILEALARTDLSVVPPEEVLRVLPEYADPVAAAEALHRQFGVDAILTGEVRRFVPRIGSEAGATRPASVWFDLELRGPAGEMLWRGRYDETQTGLAGDLASLPRAFERRFRWVTAEDLTAYGARELVAKLPLNW
jgi:hypothetical protein